MRPCSPTNASAASSSRVPSPRRRYAGWTMPRTPALSRLSRCGRAAIAHPATSSPSRASHNPSIGLPSLSCWSWVSRDGPGAVGTSSPTWAMEAASTAAIRSASSRSRSIGSTRVISMLPSLLPSGLAPVDEVEARYDEQAAGGLHGTEGLVEQHARRAARLPRAPRRCTPRRGSPRRWRPGRTTAPTRVPCRSGTRRSSAATNRPVHAMSAPSKVAPTRVSTMPPPMNWIATAQRWSMRSWFRLKRSCRSPRPARRPRRTRRPSGLMWPSRALVLTSTMPANPTSRPTTLPALIDSPSRRQASTATSSGCR